VVVEISDKGLDQLGARGLHHIAVDKALVAQVVPPDAHLGRANVLEVGTPLPQAGDGQRVAVLVAANSTGRA